MNIKPLTPQRVFDNALNAMRARNYEPAFDQEKQRCMYRSPVGPCVIGASIPDEMYNAVVLEGINIGAILSAAYARRYSTCASIRQLFKDINKPMLIRMQYAHDALAKECSPDPACRKSMFEQDMIDIAVRYGLTYFSPNFNHKE